MSTNNGRKLPATTGELTAAEQRLLLGLRRVGWGQVFGLEIAGGVPVLDPPPVVNRSEQLPPTKFGAEFSSDRNLTIREANFIATIRSSPDRVVHIVDVVCGEPTRMIWEEVLQAD